MTILDGKVVKSFESLVENQDTSCLDKLLKKIYLLKVKEKREEKIKK